MPKYQTYGQYDARKDEFPESAEKVLRAGEEAASGDFGKDATASEELRKDEQQGFYNSTAREANKREGLYQGSGLVTALNGARGKSKGGSFMKRRAPLFAIIAVLGGMIVGIGFSQVMMPFHIIETFTEMTDTAFSTRAARMPKLVKTVFNLEGSDYAETTSKLFGGKTTRYRRNITSKRVMNRLEAEGITVNKASGIGETTLTYHRSDGVDVEVKAEDYSELYRGDAEFRNKMNRGGRSFLGRIAAHIDLTLANFLNSHNLTKNLFKGWINKVYDAEGQTMRLHDLIEQRKLPSAGDVESSTARKSGDTVDEDAEPTKMNKNADSESLGKNYADAISKIASVTTSAVCGTAAVASMVTAAKLVVAYNNARLGWSSFGEMGDKMRAGYGEAAPMGAKMEQILTPDENGKTAMDAEQPKWAISGGNYRVDKDAEDVSEFSAGAIKKSNNFINDILEFFGLHLEGSFLGDVGMSTKWIIFCAGANIATAAVSVALDILTLGTFSVGKLAVGATIGVGLGLGFSRLSQMLVENAKSDFCNDPDVVGVKLGACLYLGASNYNGINAQNGGAALVTKEKAEEAYTNYRIALAEEAELIRSTKSPFDTSSSHTFLGSIMSKLSMLAIDMPSLTAAASTLTNLASTAITNLLPTASAIDQSLIFENELRTDCSNLDFGGGIVAVGYADCEAWFTTDQSMNNIDPEEAFVVLANYMSVDGKTGVRNVPQFLKNSDGTLELDENGNEKINPESDLGKYISYCAYRNSPFGQVDQNIMDAESQILGLSGDKGTLLSSILNALPLIGDALDMFTAAKQIATLGWSTGANCVARSGADENMEVTVSANENGDYMEGSTQTADIPVVSWEKFMKYAQSYVADARYMETMGDSDYVSPVLTYARENGLVEQDSTMSFVEYLAKYSGYTVENMQIALNEIEYWTYIGQYDPEGKGPMKFTTEAEPTYDFTLPEVVSPEVLAALPRRVVYLTREQWTTA